MVIPPWNFPLAILAGMTIGPVMAGNTVVLKPASTTPLIGAGFMDLVEEAGFPPGVINFLPGSGGEMGDALVDHPRTRFVNFTGSKEVGLRIAERSAKVNPGQKWLKRAYMEMGGKDALIVDETADLDVAAARRGAVGLRIPGAEVLGVLPADPAGRDPRRGARPRSWRRPATSQVGPAAENHAVGPVISAAQHASILAEIESGKGEADLVAGGNAIDLDGGYFIEPTIFAGVDPAGPPGPARDLRAGAVGDQGAATSITPSRSPTAPSSASPAASIPGTAAGSNGPGASSTSATSTSTARSPEPWWGCSRSAASTCRAATPRRAVPTTCGCSWR